jgi:CTP:molybdopterin cytidylyltransferase MocA
MTDNTIAAVILAAGSGKRIGVPKAFLQLHDHSFIEEICCRLKEAGILKLLIVTTPDQEKRFKEFDLPEHETVLNLSPEKGQFSSVRLGVHAVAGDTEGVMFIPVDHPAVGVETFMSLIHIWQEGGKREIIIPSFQESPGHPVIIPGILFDKIEKASQKATLRDIILKHKDLVREVPVTDSGVVTNINTLEDYENLLEAL